jgi:uncharacterized metal-binding protein YceD (DUF177 family)
MSTSSPNALTIAMQPARLPKKGEHFAGSADAEACRAIAAELGILSIESLAWTVNARPWRKDGFQVTGQVTADVSQACIVTLEPVAEHISEEINLRFLPAEKLEKTRRDELLEVEVAFDAEPEDEPEVFSGDTFDLGPLIIEHMALGLNPYPRKAGAELGNQAEANAPADENALARALRQWSGDRK